MPNGQTKGKNPGPIIMTLAHPSAVDSRARNVSKDTGGEGEQRGGERLLAPLKVGTGTLYLGDHPTYVALLQPLG